MAEHEDGVPESLVLKLRDAVGGEAVGGEADSATSAAADQLAAAAERMLRGALVPTPMTRAQALDVLGADALVTYAFEAAADEPEQFIERADAAMRRIAALAEDAE
jgi:hypothetical protein